MMIFHSYISLQEGNMFAGFLNLLDPIATVYLASYSQGSVVQQRYSDHRDQAMENLWVQRWYEDPHNSAVSNMMVSCRLLSM